MDQDCDGIDDVDADGDGSLSSDDCDDDDPSIYPGAEDACYDNIDADCAEDDDFDCDGDGEYSEAFGGSDCDDYDASVYEGAPDAWYDGVDSDCDDADDFDMDGDGYSIDVWGGDDCDDTTADVHPGVEVDDCGGGTKTARASSMRTAMLPKIRGTPVTTVKMMGPLAERIRVTLLVVKTLAGAVATAVVVRKTVTGRIPMRIGPHPRTRAMTQGADGGLPRVRPPRPPIADWELAYSCWG